MIMLPKVRAALDAIEEAAHAMDGQEAYDLWSVLSAMRGPDDDQMNKKWATTAVVRAFTLPYLANRVGADVNDSDAVAAPTLTLLARLATEARDAVDEHTHFQSHIAAAFSAISGMRWPVSHWQQSNTTADDASDPTLRDVRDGDDGM